MKVVRVCIYNCDRCMSYNGFITGHSINYRVCSGEIWDCKPGGRSP